jgi:hypothetical protein
VGPEAIAIEGAYKAGGITLAVCVTLLIGIVFVFRKWQTDRLKAEALREGDHQQTRADLTVLQRNCTGEVAALNAARLADQKAVTGQFLAELKAARDSLDASSSAGRDQAEATEAMARNLMALQGEVRDLAKSVVDLRTTVAALQAAKKGGG